MIVILYIFIILIAMIVLLFAWIMIAPFVFYMNTDMQLAYAKISGIGKVQITWINLEPKIALQLLFFNVSLPKTKKIKKEQKPRQKKKTKLNIRPSVILKYGGAIIRSFKIKIFRLNLYTEDYLLNAWLFPVFCMFRSDKNVSYSVNFDNVLSLEMMITNRMGRLAWPGLKIWMNIRK